MLQVWLVELSRPRNLHHKKSLEFRSSSASHKSRPQNILQQTYKAKPCNCKAPSAASLTFIDLELIESNSLPESMLSKDGSRCIDLKVKANTHLRRVCMYVCINKHNKQKHTYIYAYTYIHTYIHLHVCIHTVRQGCQAVLICPVEP